MTRRLIVSFAHRWAICAGCGDHAYTHARKVGGQYPVPVCNRCTRSWRRVLAAHPNATRADVAALQLLRPVRPR